MCSNLFNRLEELFIAFLLVAMTLVTFSQFIARSVFNSGVVWAMELSTYLFAWLVLFGASYGVRVGAHIGIDAMVKLLPSPWQRTVTIIALLVCLAYCVIFFIGGTNYVYKIYQTGWRSIDLPIPQWLPYSILPLGLALLFWRFAQTLFKIIKGSQVQLLVDGVQETLNEFDYRVENQG